MTKTNPQQFTLTPIGKIKTTKTANTIQIDEPYRPALKQLDQFSHVIVIWWANQHDNPTSRSQTQTTPPYANKLTGVFACRAEYRPNPIAITTCAILEVDEEKGTITVPWMDAYDETPILDLKAYFPVCDRVKEPHIPTWLSGWPEWIPDSDFDPEESNNEEPSIEKGKVPNSGRLGRLASVITQEAGMEVTRAVFSDWEKIKAESKAEKSEKVQDLMNILETKVGNEKAVKIMHHCGGKCYDSIAYLQRCAEELRDKKPQSLEEHVKNLNKKFGKLLKTELAGPNTLIIEQPNCRCMVKNAKKKFDNKIYCQCGVGCRKKFFEAILGKPVEAELVESIANGGETCKFLLKL